MKAKWEVKYADWLMQPPPYSVVLCQECYDKHDGDNYGEQEIPVQHLPLWCEECESEHSNEGK